MLGCGEKNPRTLLVEIKLEQPLLASTSGSLQHLLL